MSDDYTKITKDVLTNGCSGVPEFNQHTCCNKHDIDYRNQIGKFKADLNLLKCGWNKSKEYKELHKNVATKVIAVTYYVGVTLFGWLPYFNAGNK